MAATAARGRVTAARCRMAAAGPVAAASASSHGRWGRHPGSRRNRRASTSYARIRLA